MKKITFLLFALISISGFSQTFDFTNSNDGWTHLGATQSPKADYWELTSKDGVNLPGLKITPPVPAIDATAVSVLGITLKNKNATTGPESLRVFYTTSGAATSGTKNITVPISRGDTEYKTYYIDFTNAKWAGTVDEIKIQFRKAGGVTFTGTGAEVFDIDKIEMLSAVPTTLREIFSFATDNDTEGFAAKNASFSGPTGGVLTITPTINKYAKAEQNSFHVNATDNKTVTIILKNNSAANDQLRFVGGATQTQTMTTGDTEFKTYTFDMSAVPEWTGNLTFDIGIGTTTGAEGFINTPVDAGTLELQSVVIDNTEVLSVSREAIIGFSVYPNPTSNLINIVTKSSTISKVQIFNVVGKKVFETKTLINKTLNVSHLNSGVYFLKVQDTENKIATQKLIIN